MAIPCPSPVAQSLRESGALPIMIHVEKALSHHNFGEYDSALGILLGGIFRESLADGDVHPPASLVKHRGKALDRTLENRGLRPCWAAWGSRA